MVPNLNQASLEGQVQEMRYLQVPGLGTQELNNDADVGGTRCVEERESQKFFNFGLYRSAQ